MPYAILLADDSVNIQRVVESAFEGEREYILTIVANGNEASAAVERSSPDLLLADVHMPGRSGYEVCRHAKALHPDLPVLLLVGTFEPWSDDEYRACGADGYLKKPLNSKELVSRVRLLTTPDVAGSTIVGASVAASTVAKSAPSPVSVPAPPRPPAPATTLASRAELTELTELTELVEPDSAVSIDFPRHDRPPTLETQPIRTLEPLDAVPPIERTENTADTENDVATIELPEDQIEMIARRVVELIGDKVVREISWEVIPDLAEVVIKERLRELERQVEEL